MAEAKPVKTDQTDVLDRLLIDLLNQPASLDSWLEEEKKGSLTAPDFEGRDASAIIRALPHWAPLETPPPDSKAKLMQRLKAEPAEEEPAEPQVQPWKRWLETKPEARTMVQKEQGAWQPTAILGIEAKMLFVDSERDRVEMLVRMAPGTTFPSHSHGGPESCFVIEGDLYSDDHAMVAGDFQRAEFGSIHGAQSTKEGCLLFISSSLEDQLLAT